MSVKQKKYKRLRKELQFLYSELEYVQEVLLEAHHEFEKYYRSFCEKNNIDIDKLNKQSGEKVEQLIPKPVKKESGLIEYKDKTNEELYKKLYKQIARKLHPDMGGSDKEFQEATSAMQEKNFEKILDICDDHDILIEINDKVLKLLQQQISEVKQKINKEKSTYSWSLFSCNESQKCKEKVVRQFLKHLFGYQEKIIRI
jgi:hypothetical protein